MSVGSNWYMRRVTILSPVRRWYAIVAMRCLSAGFEGRAVERSRERCGSGASLAGLLPASVCGVAGTEGLLSGREFLTRLIPLLPAVGAETAIALLLVLLLVEVGVFVLLLVALLTLEEVLRVGMYDAHE